MSAGIFSGVWCRVALVLALVVSSRGFAQDGGGEGLYAEGSAHVTTRIIPSSTRVRVGDDEAFLTVRLLMEEGWHTYWPGLNDTGYGVSIEMEPVEGVTFGEPIFPTPERYLAPGNIMDHIYEGRMIVLVPYTMDESVEAGTTLEFSVKTDFLVCKDVCLPGKGEAKAAVAVIPSDRRPILSFSERRMQSMWKARAVALPGEAIEWNDDGVSVTLEGASRYEFFPAEGCVGFADLKRDGDVLSPSFEPELAGDGALKGRLRVTFKDGSVRDYDVDSNRE